MKIDIEKINNMPDGERFNYLRQNKDLLIKTKKSTPDHADVCNFGIINIGTSRKSVEKEQDNGIIRRKVVANTSNWIDSQMDMILPGAVTKSLKERKSLIPHLHDHIHRLDAKVGEVFDIYEMIIQLTDLGLAKMGSTTVLVFETDIYKSYNDQIYNQYKHNKINQHSIGLQYIDIALAINDPNDNDHYDIWVKYIDMAINKELAIERGYFWIVREYKLLENSSVLFGANELTPTLMQAALDAPEKQIAVDAPEFREKKELNFEYIINNLKL